MTSRRFTVSLIALAVLVIIPLLPWLLPRVPDAQTGRRANDLSVIDRWKILDNLRRSLDRPPFDLVIAALDKRQKGVDDLPMGKAANLRESLIRIALIQKIEELFLETAAVILQLKGPCARKRKGEKNLDGNLSNEVGRQ